MTDPNQYRDTVGEFSLRSNLRPSRMKVRRSLGWNEAAPRTRTTVGDPTFKIEPAADTKSLNAEVLTEKEKAVLCSLGAALIIQWKTLPAKLSRELLDNADAIHFLVQSVELRDEIARLLQQLERDGDEPRKLGPAQRLHDKPRL